MNAKQMIEEEKLFNILNPHESNMNFKITLKFQRFFSPKFEKAVEFAKKNKYFLEEGEGNYYKIYTSFHPEEAWELQQLFDLVHKDKKTEIYLNNKCVPYIHDLWLFLMWFYKY